MHRSFVWYGRSGTGKTTVVSTFPKPLLLLDVKDVGDDSISDVDGIDVMDVKSWDDLEMVYWFVKKHPGKYKTVAIDTMSQLQQLAIEKVLVDNDKEDKAERAGDWGVLTKQDWGRAASLLKTWIINYRDLPLEVAFIAQDRTFNVGEEDEAQGLEPEVGPGLMPSVAKHLNAAVHVVANTFIRRRVVKVKLKHGKPGRRFVEKDRIEYCARLGPNPVYLTKIRKPKPVVVPTAIVDPTYDKILEIIRGK